MFDASLSLAKLVGPCCKGWSENIRNQQTKNDKHEAAQL